MREDFILSLPSKRPHISWVLKLQAQDIALKYDRFRASGPFKPDYRKHNRGNPLQHGAPPGGIETDSTPSSEWQRGANPSNGRLLQEVRHLESLSVSRKQLIVGRSGRRVSGAVRPGAWCSSRTCRLSSQHPLIRRMHAPMGREHPRPIVRLADSICSWISWDVRAPSTPHPASTPQRAVRRMPSPLSPAREMVHRTPQSSGRTIGMGTWRPHRACSNTSRGFRGQGRMPLATYSRIGCSSRDAGGPDALFHKLRRGTGNTVRLRAHGLAPTRTDHGMDQNTQTNGTSDLHKSRQTGGLIPGQHRVSRRAPDFTKHKQRHAGRLS